MGDRLLGVADVEEEARTARPATLVQNKAPGFDWGLRGGWAAGADD